MIIIIKIILIYITVAMFLLCKNFYLCIKCYYLIYSLERDREAVNNYRLIIPIKTILNDANIYCSQLFDLKNFTNYTGVQDIIECIHQAQGIYYNRCKRSFLWLFYLICKIRIFRPILMHTSNKFFAILACLIEWFVLYLLGLYLDTTGIGSKILQYLLSSLSQLIELVKTLV